MERSNYRGRIEIPRLGKTVTGVFGGVNLQHQPHGVLIGRGVLKHYRMTYDGLTGEVIFGRKFLPRLREPFRSMCIFYAVLTVFELIMKKM